MSLLAELDALRREIESEVYVWGEYAPAREFPMRKKITVVSPMAHGHLMLEFEDGSKQTVFRGDHEKHAPEVGDVWPPYGHQHVAGGIQTGDLVKKD